MPVQLRSTLPRYLRLAIGLSLMIIGAFLPAPILLAVVPAGLAAIATLAIQRQPAYQFTATLGIGATPYYASVWLVNGLRFAYLWGLIQILAALAIGALACWYGHSFIRWHHLGQHPRP